jgi:hypothetical protein
LTIGLRPSCARAPTSSDIEVTITVAPSGSSELQALNIDTPPVPITLAPYPQQRCIQRPAHANAVSPAVVSVAASAWL